MNDIPAEDLERAQQMVARVHDALAEVVKRLPYDAELGVEFCLPQEAE